MKRAILFTVLVFFSMLATLSCKERCVRQTCAQADSRGLNLIPSEFVEPCRPELLSVQQSGEGMWPWQDLARLDEAALRARGLELPLSELWTPGAGGLAQAVVGLRGCTGAFVSEHGLLITNHHCAMGAIQKLSRPDQNLLENGFVARSRTQELPAPGMAIWVFNSQRDVTAEIFADLPGEASDLDTAQFLRKREKELVAECEKKPSVRCSISRENDGLRFYLMENTELTDVRLVFAPPESLGAFGGEVDNWRWPRHTLDFALLRAWVGPDKKPAAHAADNVPFTPPRHLSVSTTGPGVGEFIMVAGTPYRTSRYRTAQEIREAQEWFYPRREALFSRWITLLEKANDLHPEARIPNATALRRLGNGLTNARGQLDGIAKNRVIARRLSEEETLRAWIRSARHPVPETALDDLNRYLESVPFKDLDFLLSQMQTGISAFASAYLLVKWAHERGRPDAQRTPGWQDRDRAGLLSRLSAGDLSYHPASDRQVLSMFLTELDALPADQRPAFHQPALTDEDRKKREDQLEMIYRTTTVMNPAAREPLFSATSEMLAQSADPMIQLVLTWFPALQDLEKRLLVTEGALLRLRRPWMEATVAFRGRAFYPDANASPRVSFATVTGYSPEDGVWSVPFTTLRGMLAKHRSRPPFDLPAPFLEAAQQENPGPWQDPHLEDVPINFLSNADTTGGNSGSPVLDGRGRFIGINFDRVYENIAGDFGYNPLRSRNIMLDVRAILWTLDRFAQAHDLLAEMGVTVKTGP
jgi:hypothetical protein